MCKEIGKIVYTINDGPRNSEGAFITLTNGNILFVYSKFQGIKDNAKACIASIVSKDGGETWSDKKILFTPDEHKAKNLMSVSLLRMNSCIGMFYLVRKGWGDTRPVIRRSFDEGETWTEPLYLTQEKGYFEVNNDRAVMLSSGRIIIPASYYGVKRKYDPANFRGMGMFFISDDNGYTWRESKQVLHMPVTRSYSGLQEPGVVELENGDLWAWFRTDMGYQYESFSMDGGDTWTLPQPSIFTSPDSPMSMKRRGGRIYAVFNPMPSHFGYQAQRNPFMIAWNKKYTGWSAGLLEDTEDKRGYCYTAIHFNHGDILLAYSGGDYTKGGSMLQELRIRKI